MSRDLLTIHKIVSEYLEDINLLSIQEEIQALREELFSSKVPYGISPKDLSVLGSGGCGRVEKSLSYSEYKYKLARIQELEENVTDNSLFIDAFLCQANLIVEKYKQTLTVPISKRFASVVQQEQSKCEFTNSYIELVKSYFQKDESEKILAKVTVYEKSAPQTQVEPEEDRTCEQINFQDLSRVNTNTKYKYEKRCHFRDTINQYQGLQTKNIPDKVFEDIKTLIRLNNISKVSKEHIRQFLMETKNSKYYEDVQLIYSKLTNTPCPDISSYEKALFDDFDKLVDAFLKIKLSRKNFLNSHYVLRQLLRRHGFKVGEDELTNLKTPSRVREHDDIYQQCCDILGWNFVSL
jgi:hypothetical protein